MPAAKAATTGGELFDTVTPQSPSVPETDLELAEDSEFDEDLYSTVGVEIDKFEVPGSDADKFDLSATEDATTDEHTEAEEVAEKVLETAGEVHRMAQMGAKRIGSLAIGIGVVGIVLNKMSNLEVVNNSSGVIDVGQIFATAGSGLNLLVVGVIIAAAAVLLSLWSGF